MIERNLHSDEPLVPISPNFELMSAVIEEDVMVAVLEGSVESIVCKDVADEVFTSIIVNDVFHLPPNSIEELLSHLHTLVVVLDGISWHVLFSENAIPRSNQHIP